MPGVLRRARLEAGLTLAEVAGTELSRQAVHLIETGQVRPSVESLRVVADRLDIDVATLLVEGRSSAAIDGMISELEALSQRHEHLRVTERAERLIGRSGPMRLLAFAHCYMGQALYCLSRPDEALEHLRRARHLFEALDNAWFVAESLDWEAIALHLKEDSQALGVSTDALRRYRALEPRRPDTEARMLEHMGTILAGHAEYTRAQALYEEAVLVAGDVRDLTRLGHIYHGLAKCYFGLGDLRRATELLSSAVALYEAENRMSPIPARWSMPRAENDLGMLLMRQGEYSRAEAQFRAALKHFEEAGIERVRSYVFLSLAELRQRQGRVDEAIELVRQGQALARELDETLALALGHQLLGELYHAGGETNLSHAAFRRALSLLQGAGHEQQRAECQSAYDRLRAAVHEAEGEVAGGSRGGLGRGQAR